MTTTYFDAELSAEAAKFVRRGGPAKYHRTDLTLPPTVVEAAVKLVKEEETAKLGGRAREAGAAAQGQVKGGGVTRRLMPRRVGRPAIESVVAR